MPVLHLIEAVTLITVYVILLCLTNAGLEDSEECTDILQWVDESACVHVCVSLCRSPMSVCTWDVGGNVFGKGCCVVTL